MVKPTPPRGRTHDAEGTREAILNAAEAVFAEHGFDGARVDAIAAEAGYNKSLIFQYFGDKLGLYAEVIRRADKRLSGLQTEMLAALHEGDAAGGVQQFKAALKDAVGHYFDTLLEQPHILRIMLWEMAEGWQTFAKIISQRDIEDLEQFKPVFNRLQSAGLLRAGLNPSAQATTASFFTLFYLGSIPVLQMIMPGEDFSSAAALARAREFVCEFVVNGLIVDAAERKARRPVRKSRGGAR